MGGHADDDKKEKRKSEEEPPSRSTNVEAIKVYQCPYCEKTFTDFRVYGGHIIGHRNQRDPVGSDTSSLSRLAKSCGPGFNPYVPYTPPSMPINLRPLNLVQELLSSMYPPNRTLAPPMPKPNNFMPPASKPHASSTSGGGGGYGYGNQLGMRFTNRPPTAPQSRMMYKFSSSGGYGYGNQLRMHFANRRPTTPQSRMMNNFWCGASSNSGGCAYGNQLGMDFANRPPKAPQSRIMNNSWGGASSSSGATIPERSNYPLNLGRLSTGQTPNTRFNALLPPPPPPPPAAAADADAYPIGRVLHVPSRESTSQERTTSSLAQSTAGTTSFNAGSSSSRADPRGGHHGNDNTNNNSNGHLSSKESTSVSEEEPT